MLVGFARVAPFGACRGRAQRSRAVPVSLLRPQEGIMTRLSPNRAATRTLTQHNDAAEMRTVMAEALGAAPVDEQGLREAVWTYVRGERQVGVAPGLVILALTTMVTDAKITPADAALARMREVILWCVEAYFGQLGGNMAGRP
jgi:hypothetical protein